MDDMQTMAWLVKVGGPAVAFLAAAAYFGRPVLKTVVERHFKHLDDRAEADRKQQEALAARYEKTTERLEGVIERNTLALGAIYAPKEKPHAEVRSLSRAAE